MTAVRTSPPQLRDQLEIAHVLAKAHIAFVVIPAASEEAQVLLLLQQGQALEGLAQAAEREQMPGTTV